MTVICKGNGKNPSLPASWKGRRTPNLNTSLKRKIKHIKFPPQCPEIAANSSYFLPPFKQRGISPQSDHGKIVLCQRSFSDQLGREIKSHHNQRSNFLPTKVLDALPSEVPAGVFHSRIIHLTVPFAAFRQLTHQPTSSFCEEPGHSSINFHAGLHIPKQHRALGQCYWINSIQV